MRIVELCELVSALLQEERERADGFLAIQRAALTLWEQIDKTVLANSNQEMLKEAGK